MRAIAYIFILLWVLLGAKYYGDYKNCSAAALPAEREIECPLCYYWGSPEIHICDEFSDYKAMLLEDMQEGQYLLITSYYNTSESMDAEIGRNRGVSAKALFNNDIDEGNIKIQVRQDQLPKTDRCRQRVTFQLLPVQKPDDGTVTLLVNHDNDLSIPEITESLDQLAQQAKDNKQVIRIIAHVHNQNSKIANVKAGQKRADLTKSYLISKGISSERIITISKGNNEPLSNENSNRVEIKLTNS